MADASNAGQVQKALAIQQELDGIRRQLSRHKSQLPEAAQGFHNPLPPIQSPMVEERRRHLLEAAERLQAAGLNAWVELLRAQENRIHPLPPQPVPSPCSSLPPPGRQPQPGTPSLQEILRLHEHMAERVQKLEEAFGMERSGSNAKGEESMRKGH